jgi:hypothetical protein
MGQAAGGHLLNYARRAQTPRCEALGALDGDQEINAAPSSRRA